VHLLLACASDAASAPNAPSGARVGHWVGRASRKRLSHAANRIISAADKARLHPAGESGYAHAEQVLSDAVALALHIAQSHGSPPSPTGYPVQQIHALLAEELGLRRTENGGRVAPMLDYFDGRAAAALAGGVRHVQSWPTDLLGCARSRQPERASMQHYKTLSKWSLANGIGEQPSPSYPPPAPPTPVGGRSTASAFDTPLLSAMFASFKGTRADDTFDESTVARRRRLAR